MDNVIRQLESERLDFWDVRVEDRCSTTVRTWNDSIRDLSQNARSGMSVRVLIGAGWGFSYGTNSKDLVRNAIKVAKAMNGIPCPPIFTKAITRSVKPRLSIHPKTISIEEKKELALGASKSRPENISSAQIVYQDSCVQKLYQNSEGSKISQEEVHCYTGASATAKKGQLLENFYLSQGSTQGYKDIEQNVVANAELAYKEAGLQLEAVVPRGGQFPIVADPGLTDVFVHEAVGHSAEADLVLQRQSCLGDVKGQQVAPEHVTIIDDASIPGLWGSFAFDDEGIKACATKIIDQGIVQSYLHSRETAARLDGVLTSNARAQNFSHTPIVRMSNTYIEKGTVPTDELISSVSKGFYLIGSRGGQVDPAKGNFQFSCQSGYEIRNGELGLRLKGVSIGGHTLKTLHNITHISRTYQKGQPGFCGKDGQSVPVVGNCPHILIESVDVGGK